MRKPNVFIGSSVETLQVVDAIEADLRESAVVRRWDKDTFRAGRYTLEELAKATMEVDFAVFVLGRDDITESRGQTKPSPRDNVIFEAGLFTAMLGKERVFYVVDKSGIKIPSDWSGLGYLSFDPTQSRSRDIVFNAVSEIRKELVSWKSAGAELLIGYWWQFVISTDSAAVLALLRIYSEAGRLSLEGESWQANGEKLARFRSRAAHFDKASQTLSYCWEGEHPRAAAIPRFFGAGEIRVLAGGDGAPVRGTGWFSSSSSSDISNTTMKSAIYLGAVDDELVTMNKGDRDSRSRVVTAKLSARKELDV
jgi:hypothetical protein